jgi:CheY-like chemotaxis protein
LDTNSVIRPCFLVVDYEYPDSISSRKLVLETAKYNVITAYSAREGLETFRQFPKVAGIVMPAELPDMDCATLVKELREINPNALVIVTSSHGYADCGAVDHHLDSFNPGELLSLLRKVVPNPLERV